MTTTNLGALAIAKKIDGDLYVCDLGNVFGSAVTSADLSDALADYLPLTGGSLAGAVDSTSSITASGGFVGDLTGTASVANKLGTSTVGGAAKPIYLSSGTATVCSSTLGGTAQPVYMNAGAITVCSATVGTASTPVYMSSGKITVCTSIAAATATSATSATQDGSGNVITDTYATKTELGELEESIATVYDYKGSVDTVDDLPASASTGDVYNVAEGGMNYAWDGSAWDALGATVDLSGYATTDYVDEALSSYTATDSLSTALAVDDLTTIFEAALEEETA